MQFQSVKHIIIRPDELEVQLVQGRFNCTVSGGLGKEQWNPVIEKLVQQLHDEICIALRNVN